jgi:hypothetical protein
MWHKSLQLGYYIFNDCMDFQRAWKSTETDALLKRYKIIWNSFHIHRMNNLHISDTLKKSAKTIARPYLHTNDPDFLLATDIEYEEKRFFFDLRGCPRSSNRPNWVD